MTCRECRAEMCTDGLLSQLRCAECRQIKFETFCNVALKAGLILSVGCLVVNLINRCSDRDLPSEMSVEDCQAA